MPEADPSVPLEYKRREKAEAPLSTAREALEKKILAEFDDGEDDPVTRIAREALASLAGGEHRAGLNDKEDG